MATENMSRWPAKTRLGRKFTSSGVNTPVAAREVLHDAVPWSSEYSSRGVPMASSTAASLGSPKTFETMAAPIPNKADILLKLRMKGIFRKIVDKLNPTNALAYRAV